MSSALSKLMLPVCSMGILAMSVGFTAPAAAQAFNQSSLQGLYTGSIDGFITQVDGEALPALVPTSSTTWLNADGEGGLTDVRVTFNVGGCAIVELRGTGTYQVPATGVGTATVDLDVASPPVVTGACDPALSPPPFQNAEFVFRFTINLAEPGPDQVLDGVGLTFTGDPDTPDESLVGTTSRGVIRRQDRTRS